MVSLYLWYFFLYIIAFIHSGSLKTACLVRHLMCFRRVEGYFFLDNCYVLAHYRRSKYNYQKCSSIYDTYILIENLLLIVPYDIYGITLINGIIIIVTVAIILTWLLVKFELWIFCMVLLIHICSTSAPQKFKNQQFFLSDHNDWKQ